MKSLIIIFTVLYSLFAYANIPPVPVQNVSPLIGYKPLTVNFDGSGSYDPDGTINIYKWTFGDGSLQDGMSVIHTYTTAGTRTVRLRVFDNNGASTAVTTTVTILNDSTPPTIGIDLEQNAVMRTNIPTITATYNDTESGIDYVRVYLNQINVTSRAVIDNGHITLQFTEDWPLVPKNHLLRITAFDKSGNSTSETVNFKYEAPEAVTHYVNGRVLNQDGIPVPGVTITNMDGPVGVSLSGTTNGTGRFSIPFTIGGDYKFKFVRNGHVEIHKSISLIAEQNAVFPSEIFMMIADPKSTSITAATGGTATNTSGSIYIDVPAGSLDSDKSLTFTEAVTGATLQDPLPNATEFTYAFSSGPSGTVFSTPANMQIDNILGFPPGFLIPVGVTDLNPTGWVDSGFVGTVNATGDKIDFKVAHFSTHDVNSPSINDGDDNQESPEPEPNEGDDNPCSTKRKGSRIDTTTSCLSIDHKLPSIYRKGKDFSQGLSYSSKTVDPFIYLSAKTKGLPDVETPAQLVSAIRFNGKAQTVQYEGDAAVKNSLIASKFDTRLGDIKNISVVSIPYEIELSSRYTNRVYGEAPYFGAPATAPSSVPTREPVDLQEELEGRVVVQSLRNSPFGIGWDLMGHERLYEAEDGAIAFVNGTGYAASYLPTSKQTGKKVINKDLGNEVSNLHYHKGFIYGADCRNNQVYRMDLQGRSSIIAGTEKGIDLNCPKAVFPSRMGGVYIADSGNRRILKINKDGTHKVIAGGEKNSIGEVSFVTEDNVIGVHFIDGNEIKTVSPYDGSILTMVGTSKDAIFKYDLKKPSQIHYDKYFNLIVLDEELGELIKFNMRGQFSRVILKGLKGIKQLARDPILKRYYLLNNKGEVFHWKGQGHSKLDQMDLTGHTVKTLRNTQNKKNLPKITSLTYSPEIGIVSSDENGLKFLGVDHENKVAVDQYYISPIGDNSELVKKTNGTFERILIDQTLIKYNSNGLITERIEVDGSVTTYNYTGKDLTSIDVPMGGSYTFTLDGRGYVSTITDPAGRVTNLTINPTGELLSIEDDASGNATQYVYDVNQLMISKEDAKNQVTTYTYKDDRIVAINYPGNRLRQIQNAMVELDELIKNHFDSDVPRFNGEDYASTFISPEERSETFVLDKFGTHEGMIDGKGNRSYVLRDENSMPIETSSAEGRKTYKTYDALMRVLNSEDANGKLAYTYDPVHQKVKTITDDWGGVKTYNYNSEGLVSSYVNSLGGTTSYAYNSSGLPIAITSHFGHVQSFEYDAHGNLSKILSSGKTQVSYTRDAAGNILTSTDALGNATTFQYDSEGRVTTITDALSGVTDLNYTPMGELSSLTDAKGQTTSFAINEQGLVSTITDPASNDVSFTYDKDGNVLTKVTKASQLISYSYDENNNLASKVLPSDSVEYTYDKDNFLVKVQDSDSIIERDYDVFGRIVVEKSSHSGGTIRYNYDSRGSKVETRLSINNKSIAHIYNYYDYEKSINKTEMNVMGIPLVYRRLMDEALRVRSLTYPNGLVTNVDYDQYERLSALKTYSTNFNSELLYGYDGDDNIISMREASDQLNEKSFFDYDALNRLVKENTSRMKSYNLDLVGNDTASGGVYNNLNQLTENNGFNFVYDDNGNLVQKSNKADGSKIEYVWDAENVLHQTKVFKTSSTLSKTIDYKYDGLGRRIERSVTDHIAPTKSYARKYVYDGEHILAILDGSNNVVAVYLHGQGVDEPMGLVTDYDGDGELDVLSLIKDHQNSVKWILDEKGNWVERIKYSAYGETEIISRNQKKVTTNNIFFYTGRELEHETGDYYYRARYYDPSVGRFLSEDPIGFNSGDVNHYRYVFNNPMKLTDPSGRISSLESFMMGEIAGLLAQIAALEAEAKVQCANKDSEIRQLKNLLTIIQGDLSLLREGIQIRCGQAKINPVAYKMCEEGFANGFIRTEI